MKLNTLKTELEKWQHHEKNSTPQVFPAVDPVRPSDAERRVATGGRRAREKVVGGDIRWKAVDKSAALLLARAPWWAHPPTAKPVPPEPIKQKKARRHMSKPEIGYEKGNEGFMPNQSYVSKEGVKVVMINGVPHFSVEEIQQKIITECEKMAAETRPIVRSAQDARRIVDELVRGLGGDMERFEVLSKQYLEGIRQTRFAVVTETSQMTGPLKEVRQFFLGSDYHEQITRLREFVELCERLQKLKESGFLDRVADTMLRLA